MLTEPSDLDRDDLVECLQRQWGLRVLQLEYLPVGFGSHHWRAVDSLGVNRFVTVDDLTAGFQSGHDMDAAFEALNRAYSTAVHLRDEAELDFVVAPLRDREGAVIRRLADRYAVTVFPLIDGEASTYGPYESTDDRRRMAGVLGRLHAATKHVPAELPRREDFALPSRGALVEALDDLDRPWTSGAFAEPTRHLLRTAAGEIQRRLDDYDKLVAEVRTGSEQWVVTHGEPHRGNVIRGPEGDVHLVDWDTTLIAPRERDLQMVLDEDLTGWDEYVAAAGNVSLSEDAVELYRRWWYLADVCIFVDGFRREHEQTEDAVASWENLSAILSAR